MLKIVQPSVNTYHNFKCGEIFCISPAVYNVTCCLCATKMHLEQFASHFQIQHLTLAEETINLEELEKKDCNLMNNKSFKREGYEDDPIRQEDPVSADDECLQQLIKESENAVEKPQKTCENFENEANKLNNTGHTKNIETKAFILQQGEKNVFLTLEEEKQIDIGSTKNNEISCNELVQELKEYEEDYNDMDGDLSFGGETNSDSDNNNLDNELTYPCVICNRSYRSKPSLQRHKKNVHNPDGPSRKSKLPKVDHKCDVCNKSFRSARDLLGHKWKHTGIICDICGQSFTHRSNMVRHKKRHTGIKPHKCKECGKEFFTDNELQSHLICHTGFMPVICEICGKRCRHRGILTAHMRRHTGERPAKCDVCGKSFYSFHDLNVHAVTHSSERPFKCDICSSTFQRKKALRIHKRIHSKDRNHVCKICGKGFAQSGGLNSHMRTHNAILEKLTTETAILPTSVENQNTLSITDNISTSNTIAVITQESANSHITDQYMV